MRSWPFVFAFALGMAAGVGLAWLGHPFLAFMAIFASGNIVVKDGPDDREDDE